MSVGVWELSRPFRIDFWNLSVFSISLLVRPASKRSPAACPQCVTQLMFSKSYPSRIDACGFETYSLNCPACAARLECLVDPADETLLLSQTTPCVEVSQTGSPAKIN
jgi:hypothetical protein